MTERMTLEEVVHLVGVGPDFVIRLERESIVVRTGDHFTLAQADRIRVCWNLHEELGVNFAGIEVALGLLDRLARERDAQEERLRRLVDALDR